MSRHADGAARLLGWAVALLPARRQEWGRAMQAELAAIDVGPERRRFALTCTRAVVSRPATIVRFGWRSLVVALLVGTVVLAGAIWAAMLTIYAIALLKVTADRSKVSMHTLATGAGIGVAAAAAWLTAAFVDPGVPTSSGPAVVAIAAAAVCGEWVSGRRSGRGVQRRVAGLSAAAGTALLIAVLIDGPLRLFSRWVSTSAPPVFPPDAPERLVDSIGVWLLGSLLATALVLTLRPSRRRAEASDAPVVLSVHVT